MCMCVCVHMCMYVCCVCVHVLCVCVQCVSVCCDMCVVLLYANAGRLTSADFLNYLLPFFSLFLRQGLPVQSYLDFTM